MGVRKYKLINKNCPVCDKVFTTTQGSPKEKTTCSLGCSNTYFSNLRHTDSSKLKTSLALQKPKQERNCLFCNKVFVIKHRKTQQYCSTKCKSQAPTNPETRKRLSIKAKERVANGTHTGWTSRSKIEPSYPEKYIISMLDELNVSYQREYKVGKWFIDFANIDKKLAMEIDGKQHEILERKLSDEKKDRFLIDNGWIILRIKWKKITLEFRNEIIEKIKMFFGV
jgi:very-short-patch-repair endonuclease